MALATAPSSEWVSSGLGKGEDPTVAWPPGLACSRLPHHNSERLWLGHACGAVAALRAGVEGPVDDVGDARVAQAQVRRLVMVVVGAAARHVTNVMHTLSKSLLSMLDMEP